MFSNKISGVLALTSLSWPLMAKAQPLKPLPHPVGTAGPSARRLASVAGEGKVPQWAPLTHQNTFADGAANPVLLTDGSVLVQDAGFPDWWKLTPDAQGSYVNGTWTQVASLPATYSPLYHSSAVLPDGRLVIEGGEYLLSLDQTSLDATWTAQGAIYDPIADTWTEIAPPPFFTGFGQFAQTIGDAQSVVLPNGTFMQSNCCQKEAALLDSKTLTWSQTGAGKFDIYDEEGWTLLPNGKVLTVDAYVGAYDPAGKGSEIYDPATGAWSSAGDTPGQLWDSALTCGGSNAASFEVGPAVLRPDGTVFYAGGNQCSAGHTAIYNSHTGEWKAGPDFPTGLDIADGPASLEPNGKVLVMASPGIFNSGSVFMEWDGQQLATIAGPPNAAIDSSFFGNMLMLPTGQILLTDFSNDIEIYTPTYNHEDAAFQPFIAKSPATVKAGASYTISGFRFNGISQGAAYGDDTQSATNYPLVRITNLKTGHVQYSRTHDHSSMAVASAGLVTTVFDVPANQERGLCKIEVVANGTASPAVNITVQ